MMCRSIHQDSGICLTDPLAVYRRYVETGELKPDDKQLRAAIQFQKLYFRVKDYKPDDKLLRIRQVLRKLQDNINRQKLEEERRKLLELKAKDEDEAMFGLAGLDSFFGKKIRDYHDNKQKEECKQLVTILNNEEVLENFPSPKGLLVNGEVGTGKSMLMNIFADSLPIARKQRMHYDNFILWVFHRINQITMRRLEQRNYEDSLEHIHPMLEPENELALFEIAGELINRSYVLMLDEFMLPDMAAAKVIKVLFTYFFKLGGVLVATSNRLPNKLYSMDFNRTQFEQFERILLMRCEVYDMNSELDYRQDAAESGKPNVESYFVVESNDPDGHRWNKLLSNIYEGAKPEPTEFVNFGRTIQLPKCSNGVAEFDFNYICSGENFGPSDYVSLASRYHTIILDDVPALTVSQKDEARKLINLIDALYEAKCQLVIRAEVEPEKLFFHKKQTKDRRFKCTPLEDSNNRIDVQNEEMAMKTQMDIENPYRPNAASYNEGSNGYDVFHTKEPVRKSRAACYNGGSDFTGEDERFAYKRAVSRINEMAYSKKWRKEGQWKPTDESMRPWEKSKKI